MNAPSVSMENNPMMNDNDDLRRVGDEEGRNIHQQELTKYEDRTINPMMVEAGPDYSQAWQVMGSTPSQNLGTVMSRSYAVGTITWSAAQAFKSQIGIFNFPQALFVVPQIAQLLNYFKFFRCKGIRLTVRLNSTVQHFGALVLSHCIGQTAVSRVFQDEDMQTFNNDPHIISAMAQETVTIEIPWRIPRAFVSLPLSPAHDFIISRAKLSVLFPLNADADAVSNVTVSVFAEFIEPELFGPRTANFSPLAVPFNEKKLVPRKINESGFSSQGKRQNKESQAKDQDGILADVRDTFVGFMEVVKTGVEIANIVGPMLADKPSTQMAPHGMQPYFGKDMPHGLGVDSGVKLSFDPGATLSMANIDTFSDELSHNIYDIMKMPGFLMNGQITNALNPGDLIQEILVNPGLMFTFGNFHMHTYLSHMIQMFDFWRGSIRYWFRFCTSRFTTMRIRIVWIPGSDAVLPASISDDEVGDVVSMVIDVTGDTVVDFTVPYLNQNYYATNSSHDLYTQPTTGVGKVGLYLVNECINADPDVTPMVYWACWTSAGSDFQVNSFYSAVLGGGGTTIQTTNLTPPLLKKINQSCVRAEFKRPAQPIIDSLGFVESGFVSPENFGDVESLVKRYYFRRVLSTTAIQYADWDTTTSDSNNLANNTFNWIGLLFRYCRGAKRFKRIYTGTETMWKLTLNTIGNAADGPVVYCPTATTRMMEFEIPYYTLYPYVSVDPYNTITSYNNLPFVTHSTTPFETGEKTYASVGDDFRFSGIYSPPVVWNGV